MTATINASTTAGVVTTADTSGILQLQTNGTAALTVDASQNVGIGTASPGAKFSLTSTGSTTADGVRLTFGSEARAHNIYSALSTGRDLTIAPYRALTINTGSGTAEGVLGLNAYEYTTFGTGSSYTERMRINSSGNVAIGATGTLTTSRRVTIANTTAGSTISALYLEGTYNTTNDSTGIDFGSNNGSACAAIRQVMTNTGNGASAIVSYTSDGSTLSERARIDSSGTLMVNTTDQDAQINTTPTTNQFTFRPADGMRCSVTGTNYFTRSGDGTIFTLRRNATTVGTISVAGSTTSYNTSSDYRLKDTIAPMTGALAKVALLKPCTYKWKVDGSDGQGFIAHELAEVEAGCVTGEKDAVDAEGNPQYQGIDTSFLVATLTAAIQELKAIVDAQGAEIAALKGATA